MKRKNENTTVILHENDPLFLTASIQFSLAWSLYENNSKTNIKRIHGREKIRYKKTKQCRQKCSNKECFHFFHFFLFFSSYEADLFLWFFFLTVSSRIRVWGGGEWVCETQRRRRWKIEADGQPSQVLRRVLLPMSWRGFLTPQLLLAVPPRIFLSSSAATAGALTQAGDVGPATWWRHDALGVPAGNVVVNLSAR